MKVKSSKLSVMIIVSDDGLELDETELYEPIDEKYID